MNRESNKHTYIFAIIMVVSVASVLSFTSESLKDLQNANIKKEKMQNILSWIDRKGCRDYDQDGWSNNDVNYLDGDVFIFNWKLALDSDGDGGGDGDGDGSADGDGICDCDVDGDDDW